MLKILHINTNDTGGAANACLRLHQGLMQIEGLQSKVLVRNKKLDIKNTSTAVIQNPGKLNRIFRRIGYEIGVCKHPVKSKREFEKEQIVKLHFKHAEFFSFPDSDIDITENDLYKEADIIHLHWVVYLLDFESFFNKNTKPVVWTLHDMEPFNGGLHYNKLITGINQDGYPIYSPLNREEQMISEEIINQKKRALNGVENITVVAPSVWLKNESRKSMLLGKYPHQAISYGLDVSVFKLYDKSFARKIFNLPADKTILLFVAHFLSNNRKGFAFLQKSMELINNDKLVVCTVGSSTVKFNNLQVLDLGRIDDDRLMALAYASADAFIIPSIEDNLPNTMLESLACGTPVIGFPVGGIAEVIENGVNGYLANEISVQGLKQAISTFLDSSDKFNNVKISEEACMSFNLEQQAEAYRNLYTQLITKGNKI